VIGLDMAACESCGQRNDLSDMAWWPVESRVSDDGGSDTHRYNARVVVVVWLLCPNCQHHVGTSECSEFLPMALYWETE